MLQAAKFGTISHLFLVHRVIVSRGYISAMHIDFELVEGLDEDSPVTTGFCAYGQGWLQLAHITQPLIGYGIIFDFRSTFHSVCPSR